MVIGTSAEEIICRTTEFLREKNYRGKIVKLLRERPNSETLYSRGTL